MAEPGVRETASVLLTIDGRAARVWPGATVWEAARTVGIDIPVLCHDPRLPPAGVCRVCAVEVKGARAAQAACVRTVESGMEVRTKTESLERARAMLVELLMADHPSPCARQRKDHDCELERLAERYGVAARLAARNIANGRDTSSPIIAVDHGACILCDRCLRACDDVQCNEVIGRTGK